MSGSIEFKINGNLVAHIYYHNEKYVSEAECEYFYTYHSWPNGAVVDGTVIHTRVQGLEVLAEILLRDINRKILRSKTGVDKKVKL